MHMQLERARKPIAGMTDARNWADFFSANKTQHRPRPIKNHDFSHSPAIQGNSLRKRGPSQRPERWHVQCKVANHKDQKMIATTEKTTGSNTGFSSPGQAVPAPERTRVRVWLTDDNVGFRNSLAHLLAHSGEFDCERQFHSAESLLESLAGETAPDVILLDVEMGGMTGVQALRPIRALAPNVRVLIVTSFFDPMYESHASRDGASAFLLKAYAPQRLVAEIHQALASPVRLAELAPSPVSKPGYQSSDSAVAIKRNLTTRLTRLVASLSAALFGQLEFHRPAATPK